MKILIPEIVAASGIDYLNQKGYEVHNDLTTSKQELMQKIADYNGMLIRTLPCDRDVLAAAKRLKVVSKHGIGCDNIDIDCCTEHGIQVTFAPQALSVSVAEHALFLMLACARNARYIVKAFTDGGDFQIRNQVTSFELADKTAGIFGLGRIGRALAKMCSGIGMEVIGYDPYAKQEQLGDEVRLMARDDVLKTADFICITLPSTAETRNGFGMREFKLMKKSAYFINVSRGTVVNEPEMIQALNDKEILGAGLDVFVEEPPSIDNPLLHMDNVFSSPHLAGVTVESMPKISLHAAMGIDEVLSGKKPSWPVNHL